MADLTRGQAGPLEWAVASEALAGEQFLGDAYLVQEDGDRLVAAVIDGLGHGQEAATAARRTLRALKESTGRGLGLEAMVAHCHEEVRATRGVVMTLVGLEGSTLSWVGVGNVEAAVIRGDRQAPRPVESMLLSGGVVGYKLPPLRCRTTEIGPGDLLVLATDGIRADFASRVVRHDPPHLIAGRMLRTLRLPGDDALVLVARHTGAG